MVVIPVVPRDSVSQSSNFNGLKTGGAISRPIAFPCLFSGLPHRIHGRCKIFGVAVDAGGARSNRIDAVGRKFDAPLFCELTGHRQDMGLGQTHGGYRTISPVSGARNGSICRAEITSCSHRSFCSHREGKVTSNRPVLKSTWPTRFPPHFPQRSKCALPGSRRILAIKPPEVRSRPAAAFCGWC